MLNLIYLMQTCKSMMRASTTAEKQGGSVSRKGVCEVRSEGVTMTVP